MALVHYSVSALANSIPLSHPNSTLCSEKYSFHSALFF